MNAKKAKRAIALFSSLAVLAFSGNAFASGGMDYVLAPAKTDIGIAVLDDAAAGTTTIDVSLNRIRDLNDDGDFLDANEAVQIIYLNAVATCAAGVPDFSCSKAGDLGFWHIVWKNSSAEQLVSNYSLKVATRSNLGAIIAYFGTFIRLTEPYPLDRVTAEFQGTRTRINETSCVVNHCTDYVTQRINETSCAVNHCTDYLSQRINETNCLGNHCTDYVSSRINLTNCLDNPCEANATVNLTSFTSDCHGTGQNFCINGHVPNTLNDNLLRFAVAFIVLAGLTFMAIQRSFIVPLMAFFGSLAFMFFLFAVGDFFTLESTPFTTIVYQVFKMTPMIPFAIGGFNAGIGFASTRKGGEPS